jgi:hypothetical protein
VGHLVCGTFSDGTFWEWDVLRVGRFESGTFREGDVLYVHQIYTGASKYYKCIPHSSCSVLKFLQCVGLALGLMLKKFLCLGTTKFLQAFFRKKYTFWHIISKWNQVNCPFIINISSSVVFICCVQYVTIYVHHAVVVVGSSMPLFRKS